MADSRSKLEAGRKITKFLESERQATEDEDLKKISETVLPDRGFWPEDGQDKKSILQRGKKNVNPASTLAVERAAGGLTTGMTPAGQPWYNLRAIDSSEAKDIMEASGVREHLAEREHIMNRILRTGQFYQSIHVGNVEILAFGGLLLFCDSSAKTTARFECCTAGTYSIALDAEGDLDTVVRRIRRSAKQLEKKYGREALSAKTQELLVTDPYKKIDIVHVVQPRETRDDTKIDNLNMAYSSIMYEDHVGSEAEISTLLSESGYHEMPYFYAPYSEVGASDYGMGLGHLLVGHTRQLNETERLKVVAFQKMIDPPTKKPAGMKVRLNVGPGGENAISANDAQGVGTLYDVPVQAYQQALIEINDIMKRIAAVAKADIFTPIPFEQRPAGMTATEYMGEERKKLQQIAPFVSLYEPKILDKVIERVHNMAERAGLFPPAPPELLKAKAVEIVYVSTVAKALNQVGAEATQVFIAAAAEFGRMQAEVGMKPTAMYKVNFPQAVDVVAEGLGAPPDVVVDDTEFEAALEADEQKEQQAQQEQQALERAEAVTKMGAVSTQGTVAGEMSAQQEA